MYYRLLVVWATLSVIGRAENNEKPLPFPFYSLPAFAPNYESVKNSECKRHGVTFLRELHELKRWAVQMYDASGKISSGVMRGNVHWLGDDRECLQVSSKPGAADDDPENIRGQYCSLTLFAGPRETNSSTNGDLAEIFDLIHTHDIMHNSIEDKITFFPSFSPLSLGLCVPRSCSPEDIKAALMEWFVPLNSSSVKIQLLMTENACIKNKRDHSGAYIMLAFCLAMTLVGIVGALYEGRKETKGEAQLKHEGKLVRIFLAFSFRSNIRDLMDTTSPKDELSCLNGLRTIFSIILYFLHRGLLILHSCISNRMDVADWLVGPKSMILRAFWNHVDTFVIMSGLLTSYHAVKRLQEGKKLNIPKMYIRRYLKFTPLFVICILCAMNFLEYTVSDAQYTRLLKQYYMNCKEAWLNIITYTNTFRGFDSMCYQPSHQLETDMHMYILSPFIVLLLWNKGKSSILPLCLITVTLAALKVHEIYSKDLGTILYYGFPLSQMVMTANRLYLNFLHRLVPYFSGILLGYILRVRKENFKLSSGLFFIGGALAIWAAHYSFLSMVHNSYPEYVFNIMEHAVFGIFQPILWSYFLCWLIFICANGQAEYINNLLSWKGFMITSRISYAFYLIQMPVMIGEVTKSSNPIMISLLTLIDFNILFICLGASIWLTLLFLLPIRTLWNIFTEPSQKDTKLTKNG